MALIGRDYATEFSLLKLDEAFIYETKAKFSNPTAPGLRNDMIAIILSGFNKSHLLAIGMCLRKKPELNFYLKSQELNQDTHFLIFIYLKLKSKVPSEYLNSLMVMLLLSGVDLKRPVFSSTASSNLVDFLLASGYYEIEDYQKEGVLNVLNSRSKTIFALLLDDPSLFLEDVGQEMMIKSLADRVITKFYKVDKTSNYWLNNDMALAIKYFNLKAFTVQLKNGIVPEYATVNMILSEAENYASLGRSLVVSVLLQLVYEAIGTGLIIDKLQAQVILNLGGDLSVYTEPKWKKSCALKNKAPDNLRESLIRLDLPYNSDGCRKLDSLIALGPDNLEALLKKKQYLKISSNLITLDEILGGKNIDPAEVESLTNYLDLDIVYYRSSTGIVGYTSDKFDYVLSNETKFPEALIDQVKTKILIRTRKGVTGTLTVQKVVQSLFVFDSPVDNFNNNLSIESIIGSGNKKFDGNIIWSALASKGFDKKFEISYPELEENNYVWILNWLKNNKKDVFDEIVKKF